ncbi:hypothetical protein ABT354_12775 [Streptomyces sp. NPDC000594]|uniref:hypothetical protein n=1 Tax=Streptomyces sp. NPDC000594 TaxID=3154261 RepID=UPI00331B7770
MPIRRALATTAVTASLLGAAALLTAPAAQAAPTTGFWSDRGTYASFGDCLQAGNRWVAMGNTAVFRCNGYPGGPHQLEIWLV